jgi:regulator of protease activity HflC (stomatin/prohibitin superfamily)
MSATIISAPQAHSAFVDRELHAGNGYVMLGIGLALIVVSAWAALAAIIFAIAVLKGLVVLQPNESLVCLLFGSYVGTERRPGFWWINPFNSKRKISRRLETLESGPLKVNDAVGNPIDIGAVIVWRVEDAAKALLEVGSYADYVKAQSETALRRMASVHPYDLVEADEAVRQGERPTSGTEKPDDDHILLSTVTLRDGGDALIEALLHEIRTRMEPIGV